MIKLYYSPGVCSLAPHILLRETGLAFSLERVDTATHRTEHGADYMTINPKGQVPLIELEDGTRISEGPVIAQYIADSAARTDLLPPPGTMERYRVLEWQNYITSELHKTFGPLFNPAIEENARVVFRQILHTKFAWVSAQLENRSYLTGENFTAADAYMFTVAGWCRLVDVDISGYAHLQAFLKRIAARPMVRETMKAEGLITR